MASGIINWILSIVGIVLISVLVEIILPSGEMQKYIKSVFAIFIVFVMIYPIVNIDIDKIDFNKFIYNETSTILNENYLKNYNEEYKNSLQNIVEKQLENNGFLNVNVEILYNMSANDFEIEKVKLNAKNLVINTNSVHIDKYKEMREVVVNLLSVESEKVVIDG